MNWKNVNLKDNYERNQNILDSLSFDTLLLEISCNITDINKYTIMNQFNIDLENKIASAKEVMQNNLDNILKDAIEYRNID